MVRARLLIALLGLGLASVARADAPESISLPAHAGLPLKAFLFQPAGPGAHPAVVMLHGCAGVYDRAGQPDARTRMWGEALAAHGYLALAIDSFSSRGVRELCRQKLAERSLKEADRIADADAALAYLRQRKDVDGARVALLGWSHGGGVVLAHSARPAGSGGFVAAVAFYPGCRHWAKLADTYHLASPLLLLVGAADDWTPAAPCQALAEALAARGEPVEFEMYPGTYHDFDNPALRGPRVRHDVPNGVAPGQGTTVAPNPLARARAMTRTLSFLDSHLAAPPPGQAH